MSHFNVHSLEKSRSSGREVSRLSLQTRTGYINDNGLHTFLITILDATTSTAAAMKQTHRKTARKTFWMKRRAAEFDSATTK